MNENVFIGIFPFAFLGMWLAITKILPIMAGWRDLSQRFPDRDEPALDRMRFQSAAMGKGNLMNPWGNVNFGGCLRFDVCQTGLRVKLWRIFGPLEKPFFIPWTAIKVEPTKFLFLRYFRLSFGDPALSAITIRPRTFHRIARQSPLSV